MWVHDHGIYREAQRGVLARTGLNGVCNRRWRSGLHVQSLPEPGFAILALGKRDIAPRCRPAAAAAPLPARPDCS